MDLLFFPPKIDAEKDRAGGQRLESGNLMLAGRLGGTLLATLLASVSIQQSCQMPHAASQELTIVTQ